MRALTRSVPPWLRDAKVRSEYTAPIVARRRYRGLVAVFLEALTGTAIAGGWPSYAGGPHRLFFNPHPGGITRRNVANLQVRWKFHVGGPVTASPSIVTLGVP